MIVITALASGSRGNCYHITDSSSPLLLECGIPIQQIKQRLGFRLSGIDACLVSHEHQDHCRAVADIMKAGIDCYMSRGTADILGISGHRVKVIEHGKKFRIGTWMILPFDAVHDAAEPFGFLLANQAEERLAYITDTYYVRYRFAGLSHLMIECNYAADTLRDNIEAGTVPELLKNRLLKSHFSLEHVKQFLQANDLSRVQEIWLLHLSDQNACSKRFKREIQELTGKPVYIAGD